MSHPPECEIERNGKPCGRWVDEPDGAGTAEKVNTRRGPKWVCRRCWTLAVQQSKAYQAGIARRRDRGVLAHDGQPAQSMKVSRNGPCPCGCGKKAKRCAGAPA